MKFKEYMENPLTIEEMRNELNESLNDYQLKHLKHCINDVKKQASGLNIFGKEIKVETLNETLEQVERIERAFNYMMNVKNYINELKIMLDCLEMLKDVNDPEPNDKYKL